MSPYSMPLWTILTKWPAPEGPQWRYPRSAVPGAASRPGVRRVGALPHGLVAADHEAVAALESPDTAARAHVHVVEACVAEHLHTADVVLVEGIAAVDDGVARLHPRGQIPH